MTEQVNDHRYYCIVHSRVLYLSKIFSKTAVRYDRKLRGVYEKLSTSLRYIVKNKAGLYRRIRIRSFIHECVRKCARNDR